MARQCRSNRQVVYSCPDHGVWCPTSRRRVLGEGVDTRRKTLLCEVAAERQAEILEMAVMPDPVHRWISVDPQFGSPAWFGG